MLVSGWTSPGETSKVGNRAAELEQEGGGRDLWGARLGGGGGLLDSKGSSLPA